MAEGGDARKGRPTPHDWWNALATARKHLPALCAAVVREEVQNELIQSNKKLYGRWRRALRSRLSGAGFKPLQAA